MANLLGSIGAAQPVTQFIDTALKYQTRQDASMLAQQEAALRAQETQNLKVREQAMQQQIGATQKQLDELHRLRPFESSVLYQLTPEEDRPKLLEIAKAGGYLDESGRMSMYQRNQMMEEDKQFAPFFLNTQLRKEQANVDKAIAALDKAMESGDQVAIGKAQNALKFRLAKIESLKGANDKVASILGAGGKAAQPILKNVPGVGLVQVTPGPDAESTTADVLMPAPEKEVENWSEPFSMVIDGKTVQIQKNEKTGELKSFAQGPSPAISINFDRDVVKQNIKDLPKLKEKAQTSSSGIQRIDKMLGLIEQGAGGRLGQVKAWLAPTLEMVGIKTQGLTDAQLYQILARTLGGSMRMEIIGPGQVSDYENRLMAAVSGGGGTATEAAKELLMYYRGIAEQNVKNYNDTAAAVSEESDAAKKSFKPITPGTPPGPKTIRYNSKGERIQ